MIDLESLDVTFDPKYRTIIQVDTASPLIFSMLDYLENTSVGSVSIKLVDRDLLSSVYLIGFENDDDALVFRIKFG